MRQCGGCRFCCWSWAVKDVPKPSQFNILQDKPALTHCAYECSKGCLIFDSKSLPVGCRILSCPYLQGFDMHRPDTFQEILELANGSVGSYFPVIPEVIPPGKAKDVILQTRSIPCTILNNGVQILLVLPLDRQTDGSWKNTKEMISVWRVLYRSYGYSVVEDLFECSAEGCLRRTG